MTDNIRRRLAELEQRFINRKPPSFEEFAEFWATLTPMDKAAFEGNALDENNALLHSYLVRLGVLNGNEKTLQQIAKELDRNF